MGDLLSQLKFAEEPDVRDLLLLNHTVVHRVSFLAVKILEEEHDQIICLSGAGYYIGATDEETGEPVARDSVEYWATKEEAAKALKDRTWTQRLHP